MTGVLCHLAQSGPLTIGEQADHLGIGRATVVEVTNRLERRGLVTRKRDDRDRRRVFVWLTEEGRRVARVSKTEDEVSPLERAVGRMSQRDGQRLVAGLRALLRASEEDERERRAAAV
jgi:DNA-binding MarR family transcriptional regulator